MRTISDYEPEFTLVALDGVRHDGRTPERQRLFLIALAALGTVDSAAQAVGISRISAYNLKNVLTQVALRMNGTGRWGSGGT